MQLHVGQPVTRAGVTIFPLWHAAVAARRYTSRLETLEISECAEPRVNALSATNHGSVPLLVPAATLFEAGLQHRMSVSSVVIAPRQALDFPVCCVEQGRWSGTHSQRSSGRRVSPFIRASLISPDRQGEVWRRAARRASSHNATQSLVQHRREARPERLVLGLTPLPGQSGVLVGLGGQPLQLECFDSPRTLREQFDAIIEAAFEDADCSPPVATPGRRARRFVDRLIRLVPAVGVSGAPEFPAQVRSEHLDVSSLVLGRTVIHLTAMNVRHPVVAGLSTAP